MRQYLIWIFLQHAPLHCLNFIEVKFIATVNHHYIKEKGEVTLEFADTNMLSDTSIFHITSPFSLALPLFSVAAYSDEI
jgi:hypothetical protein